MRSGFRRKAAPVGAALIALLPLAASPANYIDADLRGSQAWIAEHLPADVEAAPNHRRMHCHRGTHKLLCRVWTSPGDGGRLYRTGHKPLDEDRVYLIQREAAPGSGRFVDLVFFERGEAGRFVVRPPAAPPPAGNAAAPTLDLWGPDRGHGKKRQRGEKDHAVPFFATQPQLAGVIPTDLVGVGPPNARYSDCNRQAMKLRCGEFYSEREKLRYRLSFGSNEQGKPTVYDVWRETAPGSNGLEILAQWADGPANLLVEICGPIRPRPANVANTTSVSASPTAPLAGSASKDGDSVPRKLDQLRGL